MILALVFALIFLASGSGYLYLKTQGKSINQAINQAVNYLTEQLPLISETQKELTEISSPLQALPVDTLSYQVFALEKAPTQLRNLIEDHLNSLSAVDFTFTTLSQASFPIITKGESMKANAYFLPYTEDQELSGFLESIFANPEVRTSSENFAGYETYLLNKGEDFNLYLCKFSSNYLVATESKQALAQVLRSLEGTDKLSNEVSIQKEPDIFYLNYQKGISGTGLAERLTRFANFNSSEYTLSQISNTEEGLTFTKELQGPTYELKVFEPKLAQLSPKEALVFYEGYELENFFYFLLELSGDSSGYQLKFDDLLKDFRESHSLDLERDVLDWMDNNYALVISPTSDPSLFTYAFSLLVEIDEIEEASLGMEKLETALENYFASKAPDPDNPNSYNFIDQELGGLALRSLVIYPEFGIHYAFLDDNHLLITSHLEGVEQFAKVRPNKDSLATRNAFEEAFAAMQEKEILNVFYWDIKGSFEFASYLLDKYLDDKEAVFLTGLLEKFDTLSQYSEQKTNYVEQKGRVSF